MTAAPALSSGRHKTQWQGPSSSLVHACMHAGYPEGSKLLSGEGQRYVIAPLGNIVEQNYTAYLDFSQPSTAAQALAAS